MDKADERWIKILFLVGIIAVIFAILTRLDVDGEHIYADEIEIAEPTQAEAPRAEAKEAITGKPNYTTIYVYTPDEPVVCEEDEEVYPTRDEVYCLARTIHGEASICSTLVKSQVAWCILNRVDSKDFPNTIREVVTANKQFQGFYRESDTVYTLEEWQMAYQIIKAWRNCDDRYRSLPSNYTYMRGDGVTNYFTTRFTKSLKEAKQIAYKGEMPNVWEGEEK